MSTDRVFLDNFSLKYQTLNQDWLFFLFNWFLNCKFSSSSAPKRLRIKPTFIQLRPCKRVIDCSLSCSVSISNLSFRIDFVQPSSVFTCLVTLIKKENAILIEVKWPSNVKI